MRIRERKVWNEREDRILKYLREERGQCKWSVIALKMEEEFEIIGRTGKQCRQRYHNHLDSSIRRTDWTFQEDLQLYALHEKYGNKWSAIAQHIDGRSENCVKNHFYSKLRKAVRQLNKWMGEEQSVQSGISTKLLSKIIETTQFRFKISSCRDQSMARFCVSLIHRLFNLELQITQQSVNPSHLNGFYSNLIDDILSFQKNYQKPHKLKMKNISPEYLPNHFNNRLCGRSPSQVHSTRVESQRISHAMGTVSARSSLRLKAIHGSFQSKSIEMEKFGEKDIQKLVKESLDERFLLTGGRLEACLEGFVLVQQKQMRRASLDFSESQEQKSRQINTYESFCELDENINQEIMIRVVDSEESVAGMLED